MRGRSAGVLMIEDLADAGEHQHRKRIVNGRFIVDRQQLLADHPRQWIEPRAAAAGQDYAFHVVPSFLIARRPQLGQVQLGSRGGPRRGVVAQARVMGRARTSATVELAHQQSRAVARHQTLHTAQNNKRLNNQPRSLPGLTDRSRSGSPNCG